MSQPLSVHLTDAQRQHLDTLITKGISPARVQTRARILLLADRSQNQKRTQRQKGQVTPSQRFPLSYQKIMQFT